MKKILATLLASAMALTTIAGLTACGEGDPDLIVWAPEAAIPTYEKRVEAWQKDNEQYKDLKVEFAVHAEGETETDLSVNPAAGADIFFFESGQIQTMNKKMYLQSLGKDYTDLIVARDEESSYKSVIGDDGYAFAFPCTADNGYFMYYDKTYWKDHEEDLESLDKMLARMKEDGKTFGFDYSNGYYEVTWFFGLGCQMDWVDKGQTKYFTDVYGAEGLKAAQASLYYLGGEYKDLWVNGDVTGSIGAGFEDGTMVAGIGGTWVAAGDVLKAHVEAGDRNYDDVVGATKLPKFTLNGTGTEYQMGSFSGGKYCGVNQYKSDPAMIEAAMSLANYFCDEAGQTARFAATNAGPSNKKVAATDAVKNNTLIKALNLQNAEGGYAQLSQNGLWDAMNDFGTKCQNNTHNQGNVQKALNDLAVAMAKGGTLVDANGNAVTFND